MERALAPRAASRARLTSGGVSLFWPGFQFARLAAEAFVSSFSSPASSIASSPFFLRDVAGFFVLAVFFVEAFVLAAFLDAAGFFVLAVFFVEVFAAAFFLAGAFFFAAVALALAFFCGHESGER